MAEHTEAFDVPIQLHTTPEAYITTADTHHQISDTSHIHSHGDSHLSSGGEQIIHSQQGQSWFTQTGGIKHIAAKGKVQLEAHAGKQQLHAQQSIELAATDSTLEISAAKGITLGAGGSGIIIKDGNITITTPGIINFENGQYAKSNGVGVNYTQADIPVSDGLFSERYDFSDWLDKELLEEGVNYTLTNHSKGTEYKGKLDNEGKSIRVFGNKAEDVEIRFNHLSVQAIDIDDLELEDDLLDEGDEDVCGC